MNCSIGKKMHQEIKAISLLLPFRLGRVNCYLVKNDTGYVLIDTGSPNRRSYLENVLQTSGCKPGHLTLIILTHGDFDHTGNAAYLRKKYSTKIAMHQDDLGMVEDGNMFWNREKSNMLFKILAPTVSGFGKSERFTPDVYVNDGDDLSKYGFDATVLHIPGHSKGSIGVLTAAGDLFCGDLLENVRKPSLNSIMDALKTANASLEKLNSLSISTVYPGHGGPFQMEVLTRNRL
jgi:hydroxyacylglutathione hydrolase